MLASFGAAVAQPTPAEPEGGWGVGIPGSKKWPVFIPKQNPLPASREVDLCEQCVGPKAKRPRPEYCKLIFCKAPTTDWTTGFKIKPPPDSTSCEDCSKNPVLGPMCVPLQCTAADSSTSKLLGQDQNLAAYRRWLELYRLSNELQYQSGALDGVQYKSAIDSYRSN